MSKIEDGELPFEVKTSVEKSGLISKKERLELCSELIEQLNGCKQTEGFQEIYEEKYSEVSEILGNRKVGMTFPSEIEEALDREIGMYAIILYNELSSRHLLAHSLEMDNQVRQEAWQTYLELFDYIKSSTEVCLPVIWTVEMLLGFVDQYEDNCRYASSLSQEGLKECQSLLEDGWWNAQEVIESLQGLTSNHTVVEVVRNICLSRVHFMQGDYALCQQQVQQIDLSQLNALQICPMVYSHLFYFQSLCLLFNNQPSSSLALALPIYRLTLKLKTSSQIQSNLLSLIALLSVFVACPEELMTLLKSLPGYQNLSQYQDLLNFYHQAVSKTYPQLTQQLTLDNAPLLKSQQAFDNLQKQFLRAQQITQFKQVLGLYSSISLEKASKLLNMTQDTIQQLIADYQENIGCSLQQTPWEQTVLKRLPTNRQDINIHFQNNQIKVQQSQLQSNYEKIFCKNIQKVKDMRHSLEQYQ